MVTKLPIGTMKLDPSSVLAKIHMVTKHNYMLHHNRLSSVLAKIHMVTKP